MKRIICIFAILIAFSSCSKDEVIPTPAEKETFMFQIKSEDVDSKVLYSNIVTVKL